MELHGPKIDEYMPDWYDTQCKRSTEVALVADAESPDELFSTSRLVGILSSLILGSYRKILAKLVRKWGFPYSFREPVDPVVGDRVRQDNDKI